MERRRGGESDGRVTLPKGHGSARPATGQVVPKKERSQACARVFWIPLPMRDPLPDEGSGSG